MYNGNAYRFHRSSNWEWDRCIVKVTVVDVSPSCEEVHYAMKGPKTPDTNQSSHVELLIALLNAEVTLQHGEKAPKDYRYCSLLLSYHLASLSPFHTSFAHLNLLRMGN